MFHDVKIIQNLSFSVHKIKLYYNSHSHLFTYLWCFWATGAELGSCKRPHGPKPVIFTIGALPVVKKKKKKKKEKIANP